MARMTRYCSRPAAAGLDSQVIRTWFPSTRAVACRGAGGGTAASRTGQLVVVPGQADRLGQQLGRRLGPSGG